MQKNIIKLFICASLFLTGSLSACEKHFAKKLREIAQELKVYSEDPEIEISDENFIEERFSEAVEGYTRYLNSHLPLTLEEEIEAASILLKRALSSHYIEDITSAIKDLESIIDLAISHGFTEKVSAPQETLFKKINNEEDTPLPYYYMYPLYEEEPVKEKKPDYMKEGKEYVKKRWKDLKTRAKGAWQYLQQKHRKYREKAAE